MEMTVVYSSELKKMLIEFNMVESIDTELIVLSHENYQ
jgi:hypothetical protein